MEVGIDNIAIASIRFKLVVELNILAYKSTQKNWGLGGPKKKDFKFDPFEALLI